MSMLRGSRWKSGFLTLAAVLAASCASGRDAEWSYFGGDHAFQRYSPLDQINAETVGAVELLWTRPGLDSSLTDAFPDIFPSSYLRGTPAMADGVLFAPNAIGLVEAFDPATGETIWVQQPFAPTLAEAAGASARGVDFWRDGDALRVYSVRGEYLYALDGASGALIESFGDGGRVFLRRETPDDAAYFGFNGPIVVGDVIVIGGEGGGKAGHNYGDGGPEKEARPEDIRGYDARTGALVWTFHLIPPEGDPARETWGGGSAEYVGNMGAWAPLSADDARGIVYVPLTAPTNSYYGGHRPGDNLYADSLVALDAATGELLWHFQMVHHDVWDYDNASPPVLGDIVVDGEDVPAVMQANKTGFLFVFDRVTGEPVWPIEERPVPPSDVPGEQLSPTQPFPTLPAPFDRQGITEDDLIDFTPELNAEAREILAQFNHGPLFTPPTVISDDPDGKQGSLIAPSAWGSGNWNTGAFDPETGRYYAVSMTLPGPVSLAKPTDPAATIDYEFGVPRGFSANEEDYPAWGIGPQGLPLLKPPYARITAYDMNTGGTLWMVPAGDGPRDHPLLAHLDLPPLGTTGRPVMLVTGSLLFLGEASSALFGQAGVSGPVDFSAYDKDTGAVVWTTELPAGTTGGPISYEADGRQIILVPVGDASYGSAWVALGLKE